MCGTSFEKKIKREYKVCSKYCENRRISLTKMKGSYVICNICNKPIWRQSSKIKTENFCSKECADIRTTFRVFKPDSMRKKYYGPDWTIRRSQARERDLYSCVKCGISEEEYKKELSVHHIKPFSSFTNHIEANQLINLISVCEPCHRIIHSGDNHPSKFIDINQGYQLERKKEVASRLEVAQNIVNLLVNTDKSIKEISSATGKSNAYIQRIYRGERWSSLYSTPPKPRGKR